MKYFMNCKTLDELKKEYRRLASIHHPNVGGDTATMQAINAEYDEMHEVLRPRGDRAGNQVPRHRAPCRYLCL